MNLERPDGRNLMEWNSALPAEFDVILSLIETNGGNYKKIKYPFNRDKFSEFYRMMRTLSTISRPATKTEIINRSCLNFKTGSDLIRSLERTGIIERIVIKNRQYFRLTELGLIVNQLTAILSSFVFYTYI